jgi:hypothetical protein
MATASAKVYTPRVSAYRSVAVNGTDACTNITCVGESTKLDSMFGATQVFFQTKAGEPYFLRVGGDYIGAGGKFQFMVDVATCPSNDPWQQADTITTLPALVQGNLDDVVSEG